MNGNKRILNLFQTRVVPMSIQASVLSQISTSVLVLVLEKPKIPGLDTTLQQNVKSKAD